MENKNIHLEIVQSLFDSADIVYFILNIKNI